jgi:two-component system, OmpR family, phosphate regulon response regulator OmpR
MNKRILIIDDDIKLQDLLTEYLTGFDFEVKAIPDGLNSKQAVTDFRPDIIILDLMLPGKDGFEVLRDIRSADPKLSVIMLTARGEDTDRIVGLEMGADDYLPKPFNPRELLARIKAVLRRQQPEDSAAADSAEKGNGQTSGSEPGSGRFIECGSLKLDKTRQILLSNDKKTELSSTEFRILEVLMTHIDQSLSRDELMNLSKGREHLAFDRSIDVHISKLRTRLQQVGASGKHIRTVWGTGYMFVSDPVEEE